MILLQSDCLDFLKTLPDGSVDLMVNDPPYFEIIRNDWDHQWSSENEYLEWCRAWTDESVRVLKPNGVMCVWGTTKTDTFLRYKLEVLNPTGMEYLNWVIWSYDWGGRTRRTFARKHEDLLIYAKGKDWLFNSDAVRVPYKMAKNVREGAVNHPLGKIPTDVWEKNNHTTSLEYCGWHPTQKPIELLRRLVRAYTPADGIVVDCFSGSGSTAVATLLEGRVFRGCEKDENYHRQSIERIETLTRKPS